jgi:CRP-like cAMP-binding protein
VSKLRNAADHRANRLLAALDPEDFAFLEPSLEAIILPRGTILYEPNDLLHHAYFPHDTIVSLVATMADGTSAEMAMFGREAAVALVSTGVTRQAFGRYIVQIPGTASRIEVERMHAAISNRPNLRRLILCLTEAVMVQVLQTVACNAVHSAEARCCRRILSIHDRLDQNELALTHQSLAEMLGVQRSTISTITHKLQAAGLIRQNRGAITVTDRTGLERAACECYGRIRRCCEHLLPAAYAATLPLISIAQVCIQA